MSEQAAPTTALGAVEETFGQNAWIVEEMHQQFLTNPTSVDATWRAYFSPTNGNGHGNGNGVKAAPTQVTLPPAVALGSYEATPLEIAGAYTMFANGGEYVPPSMVKSIRSHDGDTLFQHSPDARRALDKKHRAGSGACRFDRRVDRGDLRRPLEQRILAGGHRPHSW